MSTALPCSRPIAFVQSPKLWYASEILKISLTFQALILLKHFFLLQNSKILNYELPDHILKNLSWTQVRLGHDFLQYVILQFDLCIGYWEFQSCSSHHHHHSTLSLPDTHICDNFSTVFNNTQVAKGSMSITPTSLNEHKPLSIHVGL